MSALSCIQDENPFRGGFAKRDMVNVTSKDFAV
jgi:hypothetical protein